jgi:hypothetical protein
MPAALVGSSYGLYIGGHNTSGTVSNRFTCGLDDAAWFSYALSDSQVASLHNAALATYTVSGAVTGDVGQGVARTVRAYQRDTGAFLGETTSSATTGAYSIGSNYSGEVNVVMLDDAAGSIENDQILRTTPI